MAGDWIKIEHVTPDKPEVMRIAEYLNISENEALGGLIRFWVWCDFQSRDGHALGVTRMSLDRVTGVPGIFDAMLQVGWLVEDSEGVHVPNFDYHLSENSKKRALAQKRKQKHRLKNVTQESRSERDKNGTLEKRREENKNPPTPLGGVVFEKIEREAMNEAGVLDWMNRNLPQPVSEDLRLKVMTCAKHALREGHSPPGLFLHMVRVGIAENRWKFSDEELQDVSHGRGRRNGTGSEGPAGIDIERVVSQILKAKT